MNNHEDEASLSSEKDHHQLKSDVDAAHQGNLWVDIEIRKEQEKQGFGGSQHKNQIMMMITNHQKHDYDVRRVCQICHKVFKSGKALGGHMRTHVEHADKSKLDLNRINLNKKTRKPNRRRNPHDEYGAKLIDFAAKKKRAKVSSTYETSPCVVCGKTFTSKNALFGHMRSHPERAWRGIKPPSNDSTKRSYSSSSSTLDAAEPSQKNRDDDRKCDISDSLTGWTMRRNRGAILSIGSNSEISSKEVFDYNSMKECARHLLILSSGHSSDDGQIKKRKPGFRIISPKNKQNIDHQHEHKGSDELENGSKFDSGDKFDSEGYYFVKETYQQQSSGQIVLINSNKKRIRRNDKTSDLEELQAKSYSQVKTSVNQNKVGEKETASTTCNKIYYCGETFDTRQAFGGHGLGHEIKITIENSIEDASSNHNNDRHSYDDPTLRNKKTEVEIAVSSSDNGVVECGSMGGASSHSEAIGDSIRRVLDFDLNEEPTSSI